MYEPKKKTMVLVHEKNSKWSMQFIGNLLKLFTHEIVENFGISENLFLKILRWCRKYDLFRLDRTWCETLLKVSRIDQMHWKVELFIEQK